ncbi:hypothetical protein DRQ23_00875 [bacterium]|nr:MAG: hypothetical protein DRQ23_00875 [bacterium]
MDVKRYVICCRCSFFSVYEDGERFYPVCKTKLLQVCPGCGRPIFNPYGRFCPYCGKGYRK